MTHAGTDHMAVPTPSGAEAYPQDVAGRISPLRVHAGFTNALVPGYRKAPTEGGIPCRNPLPPG